MNAGTSIAENTQKHKLDQRGIMAPATGDLIRCGISHAFHNKTLLSGDKRDFAKFPAQTLSADAFFQHILSGKAWAPGIFKNDHRANVDWIAAHFIAADYDEHVSVPEAVTVPFVRQHAMLVHPSASSGKKRGYKPAYRRGAVAIRAYQRPRPLIYPLAARGYGPMVRKTRVIFRLSAPITGDFENYRTAAQAICRHLGLPADPVSFKPAQLYYGSDNRYEQPCIQRAAELPIELVNELAAELRAERERQEAERAAEWERMQFVSIDFSDDRAGAKVKRALEDAYNKVASAAYDRTGSVYGQAFRLGRLLAYWPLSEQDAITTLTSAAQANGSAHKYGDDEILRHIHNGIADGMADPEPLAMPTHDKRGVPLEDAPELDTLTDARAIWDDIKTLVVEANDIQAAPIAAKNVELHPVSEPEYPDNSEGLTQGVILGLLLVAPKNAAAIAKAIDTDGKADKCLTLPQMAELSTMQALGITPKILYNFVEKGHAEQLFTIFSIGDGDELPDLIPTFSPLEKVSIEKTGNKSRGRPITTAYRLRSNAELIDYIRAELPKHAADIAGEYDGKALPFDWQRDQLADLPGAIDDIETLEALREATQDAAAVDRDFADDHRLSNKRASELIRFIERELDSHDLARDYSIEPKDDDRKVIPLIGMGYSAHNILAAHAARHYYERERLHNGDGWLYAKLYGISTPTVRKIRVIAHLKYAADTRETARFDPDQPEIIASEIARVARHKGGRALLIGSAGQKPVAYRRENLAGVIACAARYQAKIEVIYSVSQPLMDYDPTSEPAREAETTKRERVTVTPTERKPRAPRPTREARYLASFRRIPTALGWTHQGDLWMHPDGGDLYPDHVPTLLKAMTGRNVPGAIGEPIMLNIHHQAEKYDEPVTLATERHEAEHPTPEPEEALPVIHPAPLPTPWDIVSHRYKSVLTTRRSVYA